jgi:hypothetical protein
MEQTFGSNWKTAAAGLGLTLLVFGTAFVLAIW